MDYKKDAITGQQVHEYLVELGLETPFVQRVADQKKISSLFAEILSEIGMDLTDDSLIGTPDRLAKLYTTELCSGLNYDNFPKATVVDNKFHYDEMVLERNIKVNSLCEHHALPIIGGAWVAYIPKDHVMGLSKLNRIVDFFCRRPQIQERLTAQIHATLKLLLKTEDVAVAIQAEHMCVKVRGAEDACSDTVSSQLSGCFKTNPSARAEFFALAKGLTSN